MDDNEFDLEELIDDDYVSDGEFDSLLETVLAKIGILVSMSGYGHVIDGELTSLPPSELDTIH